MQMVLFFKTGSDFCNTGGTQTVRNIIIGYLITVSIGRCSHLQNTQCLKINRSEQAETRMKSFCLLSVSVWHQRWHLLYEIKSVWYSMKSAYDNGGRLGSLKLTGWLAVIRNQMSWQLHVTNKKLLMCSCGCWGREPELKWRCPENCCRSIPYEYSFWECQLNINASIVVMTKKCVVSTPTTT